MPELIGSFFLLESYLIFLFLYHNQHRGNNSHVENDFYAILINRQKMRKIQILL